MNCLDLRYRKSTRWEKKDTIGWLFVLPTVLGVLVFSIYPIIRSAILSFYNHNGVRGIYIGIQNYVYLTKDPQFKNALINTLYIGLLGSFFGQVISLILATLINECKWGKNFFKSIFFLPHITSMVAACMIFLFIFKPDENGLVNQLLVALGLEPCSWFSGTKTSRISLVLMGIWHGAGYNAVIWFAGLQSVPKELIEAAEIDGANAFQRWWRVTMPCIKPITVFMVVMSLMNMWKRFGDVYLIGGQDGNPGQTLTSLVTYIYSAGFFYGKYGRASAAAMVVFVLVVLTTLLNMKVLNKPNDE